MDNALFPRIYTCISFFLRIFAVKDRENKNQNKMATAISLPQNVSASSPLGALIAHFNASSKSVQKSFAKLFAEYTAREAELKLQEKIERGEQAIRHGEGISQMLGESTEAFFERLCTM